MSAHNLTFNALRPRDDRRSFRKRCKRLLEARRQLPVAPSGVRKYQIQHLALLAGRGNSEKASCFLSEFEQPNALPYVGLLGGLMPRQLARAPVLVGAPLGRDAFKKSRVDVAVQLVH